MKILCINHEYPPIGGGGATACKALTREFTALGHDVTVVSAAYNSAYTSNDGAKATLQFDVQDGVYIHRLKCRRSAPDQASFFEMLSFLMAAFRFLPKLVKKSESSFDIVIAFFGIPSGVAAWYIKKRFKLPYVVRLGGGDIPGTQKRFALVYTLLTPALKAIWRNASCVVANSQGLRERAERFYDKARFAVITNGVNLDDFPLSERGNVAAPPVVAPAVQFPAAQPPNTATHPQAPKKNTFHLITTARIVERKGIQHVIEALPRLIKETSGNIRYTIIGDGPYRNEIEILAKSLDVSEYIEITGMIPFNEVVERLSKADIFVLTSHWEGMPNAVAEAMAMRLPVIMTACEGSAELIGENGYIIELDENIAANLSKKILTLYNDNALLANMGQKSYERVCESFLWNKSAKEYLTLL